MKKIESFKKLRILQLAHNHPDFHPGGTEIVALALHREALRRGVDSWFIGALDDSQRAANPGTQMMAITPDQREAAIFFDEFNRFKLEQDDHYGGLRELRNYLEIVRPDVIHIHHVLSFGLELFFLLRDVCPQAKIIFTLHDYYLICANNGQLFKHAQLKPSPSKPVHPFAPEMGERCDGPSLGQCLQCFPDSSGPDFVMRELDISRAVALVDHLVAPSFFLKEKIERHIRDCPPVTMIENGYVGSHQTPLKPETGNGALVFGYFGNISAVKGLSDLLAAAVFLQNRRRKDFVIHVHGSQLFEDERMDNAIEQARNALSDRLIFFGKYQAASVASRMASMDVMVFPSLWWENAPLVIYEALHHQKMVLAYPHGGGAEILARYRTGMTASRSDPLALADAMEKVLDNPSVTAAISVSVPGIEEFFQACNVLYSTEKTIYSA